jgi:hypothetical protein
MINLFGQGPKADPAALARVKEWAREVFGLTDDAVVMVTELRCAEDDCPDVETVIAVMGEPGKARNHKVPKAAADITHFDVLSLAARGTHG